MRTCVCVSEQLGTVDAARVEVVGVRRLSYEFLRFACEIIPGSAVIAGVF